MITRPNAQDMQLGHDSLYAQEREEIAEQQSYTTPTSVAEQPYYQLFIGGMSSHTDLRRLQEHLKFIIRSKTDIRVSLVRRLRRNTFSGYGIIKNLTEADSKSLLAIGNFKLDGCWFGLKPFFKKKSDILSVRYERDLKKIYISGLTSALTESDLERYFSQFGHVNHIQISKFQNSHYYKGFGFLEFLNQESIPLVLQNSIHKIKGINVSVEKSKFFKGSVHSPKSNPKTLQDLSFARLNTSQLVNSSGIGSSEPELAEVPEIVFGPGSPQNIMKKDLNHTSPNIRFNIRIPNASALREGEISSAPKLHKTSLILESTPMH